MNQKLNLKEIVVLAMLSVIMGIVSMGLDTLYAPLNAIMGSFGGETLNGFYLISALLSMYIIRKPGAGLVGSLFTGVVNLLMGSPYGINIIVAATLQGVGVEIIAYLWKYKNFNVLMMTIASMLAILLVTIRDYFVFGFAAYGNLIPIMLIIRLISAAVLGGLLSMVIGNAIVKTGALNGFRIGESRNR